MLACLVCVLGEFVAWDCYVLCVHCILTLLPFSLQVATKKEAETAAALEALQVEVETLLFDAEGRQVAGSSAFLHAPHNHTSRFIKPPSLDSPHSHLSRRWAR